MIQGTLTPDTVFFLGDLFDGGREWATATSSSPEEQFKRYGDVFWRREYARFVRIFVDTWNDGGTQPAADRRGRKLIASLPGNHDLGFGNGVQLPVRRRFQAFFGPGNRVDVVGNHTFVSVDTVSLSAMDQPDPQTGGSGTGAGDHVSNGEIWGSAKDFLDNVRAYKARGEAEELRVLKNQREGTVFRPGVYDAVESTIYQNDQPRDLEFPTILLTHVPLYRKPATPCGPLREHYPPSSTDPYPEEDEPNALKIHGGYQYQNVLTPAISNKLISTVGPEIAHIYSGDDHDYCEVIHREYTSSPKEITVKSLSWAMGVRRPGFLLTTLWNPVDLDTGKPIGVSRSSPTLQNHLCLLPDQLGVFTRYAFVLTLTLVVLFVRSIYLVFFYPEAISSASRANGVLPYTEPRRYRRVPQRSGSKSTSTTLSGSISSFTDSAKMRFLPSNGALNPYNNNANTNGDHSSGQAKNFISSASDGDDDSAGHIDDPDENDGGDVVNGHLHTQRNSWKQKKASKLLASRQRSRRQCCFGTITTTTFTMSSIDLTIREFLRSVRYVAVAVMCIYFLLIWIW
jgi:ethanolamine phosphate phosphodiesterase